MKRATVFHVTKREQAVHGGFIYYEDPHPFEPMLTPGCAPVENVAYVRHCLPVHRLILADGSEAYIAIGHDLRKLLEAQIRREEEHRADVMAEELHRARHQIDDETIAKLGARLNNFNRAPLWRRLLLACRGAL